MDYGYDLVSPQELVHVSEEFHLGQLFLSLGSPTGTLLINPHVSLPRLRSLSHICVLFVFRPNAWSMFCQRPWVEMSFSWSVVRIRLIGK